MINVSSALNRIQAAKFEQPVTLFHGTSSKFLKSILTNGLMPSSKEGRWIGEDDGASESQRSRASYGGIYFTNNFGTATGAASNLISHTEPFDQRTSNVLVVCVQIQPGSTVGDEDDYKFNLFNAQNISDYLIPNILGMYRSGIKFSGTLDSKRFNKQAFDAVQSNVDYLLRTYAPQSKSRDDGNKLVGLAREVVLTELERKIAYRSIQSGTKSYYSYDNDAKKAIDRINYRKGGLPYGEPLPQKMRPFSKQKAEQRARQALDLFVQATKGYAKTNLESQRGATYTRGTARVMDVVGFRGRNKITCIIELVQSKTTKYGNDIVLHYGTIPEELKRQYVQTKGPWPQVFNKAGETIESAYSGGVLYHGTKITANAEKILKEGLAPPDIKRKGLMVPVKGKVYLTSSLRYAVIYALGGDIIGSDYQSKDWDTEPFGYVFSVTNADIQKMQPDEDSVGEFFSNHMNRNGDFEQGNISDNQVARAKTVWSTIKYMLTPNQISKIKQGEYAYFASGGKRALKNMPKEDKAWLINYTDGHIAFDGKLKPNECWKFEKSKAKLLNEDCSNFFELAEKIDINNEKSEAKMQFVDSGDSDLPFLKNPNPDQLLVFGEKHNRQLRGLIDGADCYWWPALAQIHGNFAKQLGITDNSYLENRLVGTIGGDSLYVDWDINEMVPALKRLTKSSRILFKDGGLWVSGSQARRE